MCVRLLNPRGNSEGQALLAPPNFRGEDAGSGEARGLPRVTEPGGKEQGFEPRQAVLSATLHAAVVHPSSLSVDYLEPGDPGMGRLRAHQVGLRVQAGWGEVAAWVRRGGSKPLPGLWSGKRPAGPGLGLLPPGGPAWKKERAEKVASFGCPLLTPRVRWAWTQG